MLVERGRRARRCTWQAWVATWWLCASSALAQSSADTALVEQAEQLSAHGDHQAALALVRVVIERAPTPRAYGVLGLASLRSDDPVGAEAAVQRALQTPGDSWVASHKAELNAALVTTSRVLGTVIVDNAPEGATVRIDDRDVGVSPLPPLRVRGGTHVIAVGFVRRTTEVTAGGTFTVDFSTTATTAPSPPPSTSPSGDATGAPIESTAEAQPTGSDRIPASWLQTFPAAAEQTPARADGWTDRMRVNVGLGVGFRFGFDLGGFESTESGVSRPATVSFDGYEPLAEQLTFSGAWVLGLGHIAELAGRFDLAVVPGGLNPRGWVPNGNMPGETLTGSGWAIAPVITPGIRLRPGLRSPAYFAFGLRVGVIHAFASLDRYQCTYAYDQDCDSNYRAMPMGTRDVSMTTTMIGGELAMGVVLGEDADWDLNLRVQVDDLAFGSLIALERRVY